MATDYFKKRASHRSLVLQKMILANLESDVLLVTISYYLELILSNLPFTILLHGEFSLLLVGPGLIYK